MVARDPDHLKYARGSATLAFGLGPDGRLLHISAAARGLACGCTCPACGARLVARSPKAGIIAHFAHESDRACIAAYETTLHLLAKEILGEAKRLWLPPVQARLDREVLETHKPKELTFDRAELEPPLVGVIPDVVVWYGERQLLVEMYVTHACDALKAAKLKALDLATVEIDLRRLPRNASREEITDAVLRRAPRKWIYNPKVEAAHAKLQAQAAERLRRARERAEAHAQRLARVWDDLAGPQLAADNAHSSVVDAVAALGLARFTRFTPTGRTPFAVSAPVWQAALLRAWFRTPRSGWAPEPVFGVNEAVDVLDRARLIEPAMKGGQFGDVAHRLRALRPDYRTPTDAVQAFLEHLTQQGVLVERDEQWCPSKTVLEEVRAHMAEVTGRTQRAEQLRDAVEALVARTDGATQTAFAFDRWQATAHTGLPKSPASIAREGGESWRRLSEHLTELRRAFSRDAPWPPLLNLPLGPAFEAAAEDRRAREDRKRMEAEAAAAKLASDREVRLRRTAAELLGLAAEAWLEARSPSTGLSRSQAARESDSKLWSLMASAEREAQRLQAERQAAALAMEVRGELRRAAETALGSERADLFLRTSHPDLGRDKPYEVCIDRSGLKRCLALLPGTRSRRR